MGLSLVAMLAACRSSVTLVALPCCIVAVKRENYSEASREGGALRSAYAGGRGHGIGNHTGNSPGVSIRFMLRLTLLPNTTGACFAVGWRDLDERKPVCC